MSLIQASTIALSITLALDAPKEDAVRAINAIQAFFDDGISPKDAATVNAHIQTETAAAFATAAAVSTGPIASPAVNAQNVAVDKTGIAWDERIHSSSKAFNADGSWRARKGIDAATKARIDGEIRAAMSGATAAAPAAAPVSLPPPPVQTTLAPLAAAPVENAAFTDFIQFIAANTAPAGRIPDANWVKQSLTALGVPNGDLQNLAHNPELLASCRAAIEKALGQ